MVRRFGVPNSSETAEILDSTKSHLLQSSKQIESCESSRFSWGFAFRYFLLGGGDDYSYHPKPDRTKMFSAWKCPGQDAQVGKPCRALRREGGEDC